MKDERRNFLVAEEVLQCSAEWSWVQGSGATVLFMHQGLLLGSGIGLFAFVYSSKLKGRFPQCFSAGFVLFSLLNPNWTTLYKLNSHSWQVHEDKRFFFFFGLWFWKLLQSGLAKLGLFVLRAAWNVRFQLSPREYIKQLLPFVPAFALLPAFITNKERNSHERKAHRKTELSF